MSDLRDAIFGALLWAVPSVAWAQTLPEHNTISDPLAASIHTEDAERFSELFARNGSRPTADQLQTEYLDRGSAGIALFTPDRIVNAANLARAIAEKPELYRHAIEVCLPAAKAATADLRAIYLGYKGLLPHLDLPAVYVVFGADNSAGTAEPGAMVIGLEAACRGVEDASDMRRRLRSLFAHETVHTLQPEMREQQRRDLLIWALREGVADFIGSLVTGNDDGRDQWGIPQEATLWRQFQSDRAMMLAHWPSGGEPDQEAQKAGMRWFWNQGNPPPGWPSEAGYWIGKRVASSYYDQATDKKKALQDLIAVDDPDRILDKSGYGTKWKGDGQLQE